MYTHTHPHTKYLTSVRSVIKILTALQVLRKIIVYLYCLKKLCETAESAVGLRVLNNGIASKLHIDKKLYQNLITNCLFTGHSIN